MARRLAIATLALSAMFGMTACGGESDYSPADMRRDIADARATLADEIARYSAK